MREYLIEIEWNFGIRADFWLRQDNNSTHVTIKTKKHLLHKGFRMLQTLPSELNVIENLWSLLD